MFEKDATIWVCTANNPVPKQLTYDQWIIWRKKVFTSMV